MRDKNPLLNCQSQNLINIQSVTRIKKIQKKSLRSHYATVLDKALQVKIKKWKMLCYQDMGILSTDWYIKLLYLLY